METENMRTVTAAEPNDDYDTPWKDAELGKGLIDKRAARSSETITVPGELTIAVRGELTATVRGELTNTVCGVLTNTVCGELTNTVRGELVEPLVAHQHGPSTSSGRTGFNTQAERVSTRAFDKALLSEVEGLRPNGLLVTVRTVYLQPS